MRKPKELSGRPSKALKDRMVGWRISTINDNQRLEMVATATVATSRIRVWRAWSCEVGPAQSIKRTHHLPK
jgi:hypothetical protein